MDRLYHGVSYYPELWPEAEIPRDIEEMLRLGINVVRMGDFAWSAIEPNEGDYRLELFHRVMDLLHRAGIDVVFCTPTASPPIWITHGHPERCFVDEERRIMSHGARQHASYEHPIVRTACLRIAEKLASEFGRHPALIAWQIDNELKCHVAEDFNPEAVRQWHVWLTRRYGAIDRLNDAWGTDAWAERYQSFEQVPAPFRTPFIHNASLSTAYRLFSRERIADFMDEQAALLRKHSDRPITHNSSPQFALSFERLWRNLDFASFDAYPSHAAWCSLVFNADKFRTAKEGKRYWVMETSVSHNGWFGQHEPAHPPGFLLVEAVATYALGSAAFCYWPWRQPRAGAELPHSAVMSSWFKPGIGYAEARQVEAARKRLEPMLNASRPAPAEVAITWSDLGRAMLQTEPLGARTGHVVEYVDLLQRWHETLVESGVHREIRYTGDASSSSTRLLVTPAALALEDELLDRIERFVRSGGVWLCGPLTGLRTAEHTVHTNAALGRIERLANVEGVFSYPVNKTGTFAEAFGKRAELAGWCTALRPTDSAVKVHGALVSRHPERLAFLTQSKVGEGHILLMTAQPEGEGSPELMHEVIEHACKLAGVQLRFRVTPGTLVCPRLRSDGSELLVVVNMDGRGGQFWPGKPCRDEITGETINTPVITLERYGWRVVSAVT